MKKGDAHTEVTKIYEARYADDRIPPRDGVLLFGMSMIKQPKQQGEMRDAEAVLYNASHNQDKFLYLGDALQIYNAASSYLICAANRAYEKGEKVDLRAFTDPENNLDHERDNGNAWVSDNKHKFRRPKHIRDHIFRHDVVRKMNEFTKVYQTVIELYLDNSNRSFVEQVDKMVREYTRRNSDKVKFDFAKLECDQTVPELDDSPLTKAVFSYLNKTKEERTGGTEHLLARLNSRIYQELLKNSFAYVFEELAGFKCAADRIERKYLKHRQDESTPPFYFIYPGDLSVISAFFELIRTNIVMNTKEIIFQSRSATLTGCARCSSEDDTCSPISSISSSPESDSGFTQESEDSKLSPKTSPKTAKEDFSTYVKIVATTQPYDFRSFRKDLAQLDEEIAKELDDETELAQKQPIKLKKLRSDSQGTPSPNPTQGVRLFDKPLLPSLNGIGTAAPLQKRNASQSNPDTRTLK